MGPRVRPGREHDITCARHYGIGALADGGADLPTLADLGYEGEAAILRVSVASGRRPVRQLASDDRGRAWLVG